MSLWEEFRVDLSEDYLHKHLNNEEVAYANALNDIDSVLRLMGKDCANCCLPIPNQNLISRDTHNNCFVQSDEARFAANAQLTLSEDQTIAFDAIKKAIDGTDPGRQKLFYLDGPGGSGKTYLYKLLLAFIRGRENQTIIPVASTGIAATLLKGGRTAHSRFGIPVPVDKDTPCRTLPINTKKELKDATCL